MQLTPELIVYCADIGSVAKGTFGWARGSEADNRAGMRSDTDIRALASSVAEDLRVSRNVALGFECPLFVPLDSDPARLTSGRMGDAGRPWSAGAGAGSLATGLTETVWILGKIRERAPQAVAYLTWTDFQAAPTGLFLWEAFVTSESKGGSHTDDAKIGVKAFLNCLPDPRAHNATPETRPVQSLIGAALLRTGWTTDLSLLATPCVVIRA